MAKRKRKMTLFDVINSGQPIGIQVRKRAPTYQPTPELPYQKKLSRWFGRSKAPVQRDPNQPLSAAEELAALRRELGGSRTPDVAPEPEYQEPISQAVVAEQAEPEYDPTSRYAQEVEAEEVEPEPTPRRASDIAKELRAAKITKPRKPRKPVKAILLEVWGKLTPVFATISTRTSHAAIVMWNRSKNWSDTLRNLNTRHAATAATVLGGIIVLGGSFYVGKMLLQRPATDPALVDADGINTSPRPDVMDVEARANQAVANVSRSAPDVALERAAQPSPTAPVATKGVFGGRNTDLNFVIVQSYYSQAEADAAVDVLAKYEIRVGVEKNLPGWSGSRDFFSVVSYDGFAKMKDNAAYQAYLTTLSAISDREAGKTLPKRLDPRPYKYRAE